MTASVPRTQARMMINLLRFTSEVVDEAAGEAEERALDVAVDATSRMPEVELEVSDIEEADKIEDIAIVFVVIDVVLDNVDEDVSLLEVEDLIEFVGLGNSRDGASDIGGTFIGTNV
ncbi:hypothetical protein DID88_003468 [Monilinia fructigena]|uniref:Uncharacterized protein n=1 Tax=Monilinia fructigena TaxID=38457 RepID=A0A395IU48_9HELO|nr:hypothetical protein DID88_003468 [Monilinia fructigena]